MLKNSLSIGGLNLLQAIAPAFMSVAVLYGLAQIFEVPFGEDYIQLGLVLILLAPIVFKVNQGAGVQANFINRSPVAISILLRWVWLLAVLMAVGFVTKNSETYSRRLILTWMVVTPLFLVIASVALSEIRRRLLADPSSARRVVFAGCNEVSLTLAARLERNPEESMRTVGFFDDRSAERLGIQPRTPLLGLLAELPTWVKANRIDVIFVALPMRHMQRVLDLLDNLRDTTASIYYIPDVFVFDLIQARTGEILGMPVVAMCETPFYGYRGTFKRMTDLVLGLFALLFLLPLMMLIGVMVKLSSPGHIIFKQRRYGLDGQEIWIYKFRTMRVMEDGATVRQATRDDDRTTAFGRFLRRFSLDELPQLINVLQGDMSLVGPRPHAVAHNEEYRKLIKGYMIRHKVLPGITGLAQVNGCRGETAHVDEMRARVNYDLEYLRNWSPFLDIKILALTVLRAFGDRKAY